MAVSQITSDDIYDDDDFQTAHRKKTPLERLGRRSISPHNLTLGDVLFFRYVWDVNAKNQNVLMKSRPCIVMDVIDDDHGSSVILCPISSNPRRRKPGFLIPVPRDLAIFSKLSGPETSFADIAECNIVAISDLSKGGKILVSNMDAVLCDVILDRFADLAEQGEVIAVDLRPQRIDPRLEFRLESPI